MERKPQIRVIVSGDELGQVRERAGREGVSISSLARIKGAIDVNVNKNA
jgi:hypothetical protein